MVTRRVCLAGLAGIMGASAAKRDLLQEWRRIAHDTDGMVGATALNLTTGTMTSLNGDERFPLASVCKFPIAMHWLALVDEGKFHRDEQIEVLPRDVVSSVSPLADRWPAQRRFSLNEMLELMVAHSDNTVVETLYRVGGKAPALSARFAQWKAHGVRIGRSERQCGLDRAGVDPQPRPEDWTDAGSVH